MRAPPDNTNRSRAGWASTARTVPSGWPAVSTTSAPISSWIQRASGSARGDAVSTTSRRASAPSRSTTPPKVTIQRPIPVASKGCERSTTRSPVGACRTAPGASRSGRLGISSTTTWPWRPWGLTIRPTSSRATAMRSVDDVDGDLDTLAGPGGPYDRADGLGHPATTTDDLAHILRGDVQRQADVAAVALVQLDHDPVRLVDDALGQVVQHGSGHGPVDLVEVVHRVRGAGFLAGPRAHVASGAGPVRVAFAAANYSRAPDCPRRVAPVPVG